MPNHVLNQLVILKDAERVKALLHGEAGPVDFNRIIPMPEILKNTVSGCRTIKGIVATSWMSEFVDSNSLVWETKVDATGRTYKTTKEGYVEGHNIGMEIPQGQTRVERLFTRQEREQLNDIGYDNSIDWARAKWGTKWNAYDVIVRDNVITFFTAWCGVPELILAFLDKHPEIELEYSFASEDTGNEVGEGFGKEGKLFLSRPAPYSLRAYELAFKLEPFKRERYALNAAGDGYEHKE